MVPRKAPRLRSVACRLCTKLLDDRACASLKRQRRASLALQACVLPNYTRWFKFVAAGVEQTDGEDGLRRQVVAAASFEDGEEPVREGAQVSGVVIRGRGDAGLKRTQPFRLG